MLSREEYDERRRRIDEQHRETIALVEAGRLAQIRALDMVWMASAAGSVLPQIEAMALGTPVERLTEGGEGAAVSSAPTAPEPPPAPQRRSPGGVLDDIERVYDELPEVFEHHDLNRLLGHPLDRGAARRNLQLMIEDGLLAPDDSSTGHYRLRYRKLCTKLPESDE